MVHPKLLKILACPETHAPLVLTEDGRLLSLDAGSRRCYRVEEDIPILLIEESEVLEPQAYDQALEGARKLPANKAAFRKTEKTS